MNLRSILSVNLSFIPPRITTVIPLSGGNTGLPFCIDSQSAPTEFKIFDNSSGGYPLNISWIESDGTKYYYNANNDIITYLDGLGYDIGSGRYYFGVYVGGSWRYTGIFTLDCESELPVQLGDYGIDYNNDYSK